MSCTNPATDSDALMPRKPRFDRSNTCIKCKHSVGNIVIRHAVYCKDCFIPFLTRKFRRGLEGFVNPAGKRRSPSGNLLIAFSGGLGSTVLLDLVHQCYYSEDGRLNNQEKGGKDYPWNNVWKKVSVCYVEVCEAYPEMRDRTDAIKKLMKTYPEFDFIPLRISHAFDQDWWHSTGEDPSSAPCTAVTLADQDLILSRLHSSQSPLDSLRNYLGSLPTQTSLHSTLQTLIRVLLLHTARYTGSSHLLFGTSLTSLAISLISSISQGGGFNVREEALEEWTPVSPSDQCVRVVRPLRDIGTKECAAYTWWKGLVVVGKDKWPSTSQGIGKLTKEFIVGLEKEYPSTVSTITRTCAKLTSKDETINTCVLCERPAQPGWRAWKSRISIRSFVAEEKTCPHSIVPHLCYGCYTTLTSKSSRGTAQPAPSEGPLASVVLPVWAQSRLGKDMSRDEEIWNVKMLNDEQMKQVVGEFLLET